MLTEGTYNEKEFESKFELSTLFAFFNRNRTVLNAIVPRIIYKEDMPSPLISVSAFHKIFKTNTMKSEARSHFSKFI